MPDLTRLPGPLRLCENLRIRHGQGIFSVERPFLARLFRTPLAAICSPPHFAGEEDEMVDETRSRMRYGEAFWRAHHEAWRRSELNQREYCEAHGIPLKAFGNWRAKFKAEPQPPVRKLLYRRTLCDRDDHPGPDGRDTAGCAAYQVAAAALFMSQVIAEPSITLLIGASGENDV